MGSGVCGNCGNGRVSGECPFCKKLHKEDWRTTYPDRSRYYNDRKRANTPELSQDQKDKISSIYKLCRALSEATGVQHHVDHIKPVSKGGMHVPDNLQILTQEDNLKKSNKYCGEEKVIPLDNVNVGGSKEEVFTDEQIQKLCHKLALRYRNREQYEDLVSEGILACLESRDLGRASNSDYVGVARRAMNDYINIKLKSVSIPCTWASRSVSNAIASGKDIEKLSGVKGGTLGSLMAAMLNQTEWLNENLLFTADHAEKYEQQEYHEHVLSVALKILSEEELEIINLRYLKGMTQNEVGDVLGFNKMWVSRHEKMALSKLKLSLV